MTGKIQIGEKVIKKDFHTLVVRLLQQVAIHEYKFSYQFELVSINNTLILLMNQIKVSVIKKSWGVCCMKKDVVLKLCQYWRDMHSISSASYW